MPVRNAQILGRKSDVVNERFRRIEQELEGWKDPVLATVGIKSAVQAPKVLYRPLRIGQAAVHK